MLHSRVLPSMVLGLIFFAAYGVGQQKPQAPPAAAGTQEFPVVLQHEITAGKTPPGTKVEMKLAMATLVNGTVIPKDAALSGEVVQSVAKTKTDPSQVSVRIDSATWKGGTASLRVYLIPWYYPTEMETGQDLQYGPQKPASATWNGQGEYPSQRTEGYKPFPGAETNKDESAPNTPNAVSSKHASRMKNVEEQKNANGDIVLLSKHSNLKFERFTTYILAPAEAAGAK